MFCSHCREERLTRAAECAVCGATLTARTREALEQELGHLRYVLEDSARWGALANGEQARAFVHARYEQRERLLRAVLEERIDPVPEVAAPLAEEPVVDALPVAPPAAEEVVLPPPPPPSPHEPLFDIPDSPPTPAQVAVEAVSSWHSVWRPFLYESIGWFIGAFLVIAGSIYFVALGWSGMSDGARALTLFGLTAAYSTAFSTVGALLLRREALSGAGRVVALIGSAIAPLAPLAFASAASPLFVGLALVWALAAAWQVRPPARAYDPQSERWLMGAMAVAVLGTTAAPLLAGGLGQGSVWLAASSAALMLGAVRASRDRSAEQAAFAVLAPLYLGAVFLIRLHQAAAEVGHPVAWATYAPFGAAVLFLALHAWPRVQLLPAVAGVGVVAAQLTLIVTGGFGVAPAFFFSSAVSLWTALWLARHAKGGTRWLYVAYVTAYLAYQSVGQLVPGWLQELLVRVRTLLGYPPGADLPFNYAAVYAVPFVVAGAALALRWRRRPERAQAGEALLRATAGGILFFALEGALGTDLRPAVWSAAPLGLLGLSLGLWLDRAYLSWAGWIALCVSSVSVSLVFSPEVAALCCGVVALTLTAAALRVPERHALAQGGLLQTVLAATLVALVLRAGPPDLLVVLGAALCTAAGWLGWRALRHGLTELWALTLSALLLPLVAMTWFPELPAVALALAAIGLALLPTPLSAAVAAVASVGALAWSGVRDLEALETGLVLLFGVVAQALAARRHRWLGVLAAAFWTLALVPFSGSPGPNFEWPWLTPTLSCGAYALTALAASVSAAFFGRRPATVALALLSSLAATFVALVFTALSASHGPLLLLAALTVLHASRALRGEVCVPVAAVLVLTYAGGSGHEERLLLAVGLTALSLFGRSARAADRWLGSRHVPAVAALTGAAVLALELWAKPAGTVGIAAVAACTLLPLVGFAATRAPLLLATGALLGVMAGMFVHPQAAWPPLVAVAVASQLALRVGFLRRFLALEEEAGRARLSGWLQGGLFAALALWSARELMVGVSRGAFELALPLLVAILGAAGVPLTRRYALSVIAAWFIPEVRGGMAVLLGALAIGLLHAGPQLRALFCAPEEQSWRPMSAMAPLMLSVAALFDVHGRWPGWSFAPALLLGVAMVVLPDRRLLTAALIASGVGILLAPLGLERPGTVLLAVAGGVALLALAWRSPAARPQERWVERVAPGIHPGLDAPLWFGAAALLAGWLGLQLLSALPTMRGPDAALVLTAALLLWRVESRLELALHTVLWPAVVLFALPAGVGGLAVSLSALVLPLVARQRRGELTLAGPLSIAAWVLAGIGLLGSGGLQEPLFPLTVLASLTAVWLNARNRGVEWPAWACTLLAAHLWVLRLGVVFSTGRGAEFILPFVAVSAAVVAVVAGLLPASRARRGAVWAASLLGLTEVGAAVLLLPGAGLREAIAAVFAMALFAGVLVHTARRDGDERSAFLAQGALLVGYVSGRVLGAGALHGGDGLVALLGGVAFSGLHVWTRRQAERHRAFVRPALFAAYAFPLIGLLAAPWESPLVTSALLVGVAAHFAVLAGTGTRRLGALMSAAAFNAALFLLWQGTHAGEAEYYVIPFGLSLLILVQVFRRELTELWQARLRAVAITTIYSAGAFRALLFTDGAALGICALACVLGVAAGIALRIRSFVYLGTGFLVTTVVANLVRAGLREPHLGALFLSVLGVLVVGFMVLFTAQRAELVRRYERMRALLAQWEG